MRVRPFRWRRQAGFTLVEVVIAVTLIVVVLAGAYNLIIHAARVSRMARNHYIAVNLAKNHIERARNFRYADLYMMEESNLVMDENGGPANDGRFRRTTTVVSDVEPGLTSVNVAVQICNLRTGEFGDEQEFISSIFTDYLTVEEE